MFYKYTALENYLDGKLVWEQTHSIAFLRMGDDFVGTYNGKECIRIFRDDSFLMTVPDQHGQHWLSCYGGRIKVSSTRTFPWRGGLEAHKKFFSFEGYGAARKLTRTLLTKKHVRGRVKGYHGVDVYIPPEDIPQKRILMPASKKLLNDQVREWKEWATNAAAIRVLRGEVQPKVPYYHQHLRNESEFANALKNGKLKALILHPACNPSFAKNLSRWKYNDEVIRRLDLKTEIVG